MNDLSALERRKYASVASIFSVRYKEAEKNLELTLEFQGELAASLEKEYKLKSATLLRYIESESRAPRSLEMLPAHSERQKRIRGEVIPADHIVAPKPADELSDEVINKALESCCDPELWAEELAVAARHALDNFGSQVENSKKVSLWTICQRLADTRQYTYEKKALYKAAHQIQQNASLELSFKPMGGRRTALNNEKGQAFIDFLLHEFEKADMVGQSAIKSQKFNAWVTRKHKEFYQPNSRVPAKSVEPLSAHVMSQIKASLKALKCSVQYVSARRLEAFCDPRNYISWMIAAVLGMKDVPLELRFNYDDTSIMFGDHKEVAGVAYSSESVVKLLKQVHRSVGVQRSEFGPNALAACMVVLGKLASCIGLLHVSIVKIYDRAIKTSDNLRLQFVNKVDACDIYVLYIRGKQKATGVVDDDDTDDEAGLDDIAHGGVPDLKSCDHASECEVAELVFNKVLGPKIAALKAEYFVRKKHLDVHGFDQKMDDVAVAVATNAYLQEQKEKYESLPAGAVAEADLSHNNGGSDAGDQGDSQGESLSDDSGDDNGSEHSMDLDLDLHISDTCPHLPTWFSFKGHTHRLLKCCDLQQRNLFSCQLCSGKGTGVAYMCHTCDWKAHPRCVLPDDTPNMDSFLPRSSMSIMALQNHKFDERAVLVVDGCIGQIRALIGKDAKLGSIQCELHPLGIDILKGPAQLSPCSNALDCCRCFAMLKGQRPHWTFASSCATPTMHRFIDQSLMDVLKHTSLGRRNAFRLTLLHIEATVSEVFTVRRIRRGWEKAGLLDLNYHQIMSHWIPWVHQDALQISGIESLFPAFFYEMATHGTLSDLTMQGMQPYFSVDFKMFSTDRSSLAASRQRGMCLSVWLQAKCLLERATGITPENMQEIPDPQPTNPKLSKGGKAVCRCRGHYANTSDGWANHKISDKHKKFVAEEECNVVVNQSGSAFVCAADMAYMQKPNTEILQSICERMQASQAVGKKLASKDITDSDLSWMKIYPDRLMLSDFGLQAGQAQILRDMSGSIVSHRPAPPPRLLRFPETPATSARPQ
jgi:hypothetical protein